MSVEIGSDFFTDRPEEPQVLLGSVCKVRCQREESCLFDALTPQKLFLCGFQSRYERGPQGEVFL